MRLRIIDINCRWFWIVAFSQRTYGEPRFQVAIYDPQTWGRWIHVWKREPLPDLRGAEVSS